MPNRKALLYFGCFGQVRVLLVAAEVAKRRLFIDPRARPRKIRFLKSFSGIGDKNSRNIMMNVYHEEFRDSITN